MMLYLRYFYKFAAMLLSGASIISACTPRNPSAQEIIFHGKNHPQNKFIIKNGEFFFGDVDNDIVIFQKLKPSGPRCVDAGIVAFSLRRGLDRCGNYRYFYTEEGVNSTKVVATCIETDIRKCYAGKDGHQINYRLIEGELPREFNLKAPGVFEDKFIRGLQ